MAISERTWALENFVAEYLRVSHMPQDYYSSVEEWRRRQEQAEARLYAAAKKFIADYDKARGQ